MPTLIVTAGASNANAYTDLASTIATAETRGPVGAAFLALSDDEQTNAIVSEAALIDSLDYQGTPAYTAQAMEWPRVGTRWEGVPLRIVRANRESAIQRAAKYASGADAGTFAPVADGNIKREKIGPIEVEKFAPTSSGSNPLSQFSEDVAALLWPLLRANLIAESGNRWGSAAVTVTSR